METIKYTGNNPVTNGMLKGSTVVLLHLPWNSVLTGKVVGQTAHLLKVLGEDGRVVKVNKSDIQAFQYNAELDRSLRQMVQAVTVAKSRLSEFADGRLERLTL